MGGVKFMKRVLHGKVRHAGPVGFTEGDVVGVELDAPAGKNDGQVEGVQYFSCPERHGLFVRPDKVYHWNDAIHSNGIGASLENQPISTGSEKKCVLKPKANVVEEQPEITWSQMQALWMPR